MEHDLSVIEKKARSISLPNSHLPPLEEITEDEQRREYFGSFNCLGNGSKRPNVIYRSW